MSFTPDVHTGGFSRWAHTPSLLGWLVPIFRVACPALWPRLCPCLLPPAWRQVCTRTSSLPRKAHLTARGLHPLPPKGTHTRSEKNKPMRFYNTDLGLLVTIELAPSCHWTMPEQNTEVRLPQLRQFMSFGVRDSFKELRLHKYIYMYVCVCVCI